MSKRNRNKKVLWGLAGVTGLALVTLPVVSSAWVRLDTGLGKDLHWHSPPYSLTWDHCSVTGDRYEVLEAGARAWQTVGAMRNPVALSSSGDSNCRYDLFDYVNEITWVDPVEIDQAGASTTIWRRNEFTGHFWETDIRMGTALNLPFQTDPNNGFFGYGVPTMVHEIGHSIGLNHDFGEINMMRQNFKPLVPGTDGLTIVWPDDQRGVHPVHDRAGWEHNYFLSPQVFLDDLPQEFQDRYTAGYGAVRGAGDRIMNYLALVNGERPSWALFNPGVNDCNAYDGAGLPGPCQPLTAVDGAAPSFGATPKFIEVCPGTTVRVPYTVGNRETDDGADLTTVRAVYLGSETEPDSTLQVALEDNEVEQTFDQRTAVPVVHEVSFSPDHDCLTPGDYRLWAMIDACEQLPEGNDTVGYNLEDDNLLGTGVRVRVLDPTDPACGGVGDPADGMCETSYGFKYACGIEPPVEPPNPGADYDGCGDPDPGSEFARGNLDCKCLDIQAFGFDDVNDDGGYADGSGSHLENGINGDGQFCFGEELVCGDVGGDPICQECGVDTNIGCQCWDDSECAGVEDNLQCWGAQDNGWVSPGIPGTCLPAPIDPASRERLTEMSWFCLDGCSSIDNYGGAGDNACIYNQTALGFNHGECVDLQTGGCDGLVAGECEEQGRRCLVDIFDEDGDLDEAEIACLDECEVDANCVERGFPAWYQCSNVVGNGGYSVGRCVPPGCVNPKNEDLTYCALFL